MKLTTYLRAYWRLIQYLNSRPPKCRCLTDLADECAVNNGGCWKGDYTVKGSRQTFSACKDELESYKVRLGLPVQAAAVPRQCVEG